TLCYRPENAVRRRVGVCRGRNFCVVRRSLRKAAGARPLKRPGLNVWLGAEQTAACRKPSRMAVSQRTIELVGFRVQHLAVYVKLPVSPQHEPDLIEQEAGGAAQRDQREPFQHLRVEKAP